MQIKHLKFYAFCLLTILFSLEANAQQKYTLQGTVKDKLNGENISNAIISIVDKNSSVNSNEYGFYSITLAGDTYTIKVSAPGFLTLDTTVDLTSNLNLNFNLKDKKILSGVKVSAKRKNDNITQAKMGTETLNMKEVAKIPVLFGEKDVLKTIQLLPGVKSAGEGNSGFSVRGGGTDQNLIQLDEAPVYNASHLLGFFSTFNSDAIKDATIIKGNSPANYGGRLSSVLDVKMKEGNNKDYNVSGGIGAISSRINIEGPIQKEKSSFLVSARRTYADVFLKATEDYKDIKLYFYDVNAKANYQIDKKNKIYLSGYFGRDVLGFGSTFQNDWGNATGTLRWNHIVNSKLFSNTSFIYSQYDYKIKIENGTTDFIIKSDIKDLNIKQDFSYYANPKNTMKFGFNVIHHTINPSRVEGTISNSGEKNGRPAIESAIYVTNNYKASAALTMDYGLRAIAYSLVGGGDKYYTYKNGKATDSTSLDNGAFGKTYYNLEPRFTLNYQLNNSSAIKAGYARNTQNMHLLSNSTSGNPTDQWVGSSYNIKPEIADQISFGYSHNLNDNAYEIGVETYYKDMQNQVDYKEAADVNTAVDIETELLYGNGRSYGLELLAKKKEGKFTGWVSYTLSKTERKINGINNYEWYNAKQDRTHDLSIVAMYQLTPRWNISGLFAYYTGNAITLPVGKYNIGNQTVYQYGARNANRMPNYHRLDFSATYEFKARKRYTSNLNFGIYNAYGRENTYSITFRDNENDPTITEAVQTSLFRWVPSITYNFKF